MNDEQYLTEFERHLRVGEPKRGEIIAELKTHLDEIDGGDPFTALGDPRELTRKYNRTHIGFFSTSTRLFITPFAIVTINLIVTIILRVLPDRWNNTPNTPPLPDASVFGFMLIVVIPVAAALLFGRALAKTLRSWQLLRLTMVWTFVAILVMEVSGPFLVQLIASSDYSPLYDSMASLSIYSAVVGPLIVAVLYTLFLAAIAVFTIIAFQAPLVRATEKTAKFEWLIYGFITLVVFFVSMGLSEFLAPYDLVPLDQRPPYPNPTRIWNDFFETPLAALITAGLVGWSLFRRLRPSQRQKQ
ncbi:MAG: hypothetical protein HY420_04320 [Candidatus Kerfeldbacteria bacterium]|nr:hypothetical protein [Candidatus Kerfeldbacteria bacterium]